MLRVHEAVSVSFNPLPDAVDNAHWLPWFAGAGLLQSRDLVFFPAPHDELQSVHVVHTPQLPWTGAKMKTRMCFLMKIEDQKKIFCLDF